MKIFSKRWRRAKRNGYRRGRRRILRILSNTPATDAEAERYNRLVKALNRRVNYHREDGHPIVYGTIECPKCHQDVVCFADPCEWQLVRTPEKARWRRGERYRWTVTDYWGGIGECCGLMLAFQPDGHAEAYQL